VLVLWVKSYYYVLLGLGFCRSVLCEGHG